ncbi:GH25 family lysozyme [Eubacterium ruminantium]|uniref:GH25 family lysozyme n=1 Tax=Eubacterium ruminantium TaxID=42322 RepID=UPI002479B0E3|nr:GH25 family lysozyme [Eubacterium ruminantium]
MGTPNERSKIIRLTWWCIILSVIVAVEGVFLFIFGKKLFDEKSGQPVALKYEFPYEMSFGDSEIAVAVEDNYVKYLHKAYVLFGEYPDCELVKISPNIERNNFDFENDFVYDDNGTTNFLYHVENGEKTSRVAIDVSDYQNEIDWKKVKNAGVSVAVVRLGFRGYGSKGSLNLDPKFSNHFDNARKAGLEVMPYFFSEAINYDEGVEEAKFAIENLKNHGKIEAIVVDTEYIYTDDTVRANDISIEDRTSAIKGFCETVRSAGYTPIIYASHGWFLLNMDLEQLKDYEFWLAAYDNPDFPYVMAGWQYTPYGSCPGVEGDVDISVWMR